MDWTRDHPLPTAAVIVAAGAAGGYCAAAIADGALREVLLTASTTLIFVALLGGVVKLLLEDVQRARERRSEQVRFVTAVLADLKSVYDRVERVRILIAAHRSALTYGNEMRDLIEAAVQLRNVKRALDQGSSGIRPAQLKDVTLSVESMEAYLNSLIDEFTMSYKPIADKQRMYEAEFKYRLEKEDREVDTAPVARRPAEVPDNEAWTDIMGLPKLREFREERAKHHGGPVDKRPDMDDDESDYARDFVKALDLASWILRTELLYLARKPEPVMPSPHQAARENLIRVREQRAARDARSTPSTML